MGKDGNPLIKGKLYLHDYEPLITKSLFDKAQETSEQWHKKPFKYASLPFTYRGLVKVIKGAKNVKTRVVCDALMLDPASRSDTYPTMDIKEKDVAIAHEATVASIGEDELFYLMSRGLSEEQAATLIVNGFASPIVKQLPMEYAVELNRLLTLEMTGSVG